MVLSYLETSQKYVFLNLSVGHIGDGTTIVILVFYPLYDTKFFHLFASDLRVIFKKNAIHWAFFCVFCQLAIPISFTTFINELALTKINRAQYPIQPGPMKGLGHNHWTSVGHT